MIIYIVENGNAIAGYFRIRENAEKEVEDNDILIEKYKNHPNVDKKPYFITEIETDD